MPLASLPRGAVPQRKVSWLSVQPTRHAFPSTFAVGTQLLRGPTAKANSGSASEADVTFVPDYSGGAAMDFHHLPSVRLRGNLDFVFSQIDLEAVKNNLCVEFAKIFCKCDYALANV